MKYSILLMAAPLLVSLVVSETLSSYSSHDSVDEGIRDRRAAVNPPAAAQQPADEHINYRPYSQVPNNIKQLLQFQQAREPIHHIAAQPPPQLAKAPSAARAQYNPQVQYAAQPQAQSHPQANYQPQQSSPQYQPNPQQIQPVYNAQQQFHANQQQRAPAAAGNVFHPEQRRLYG